MTARVRYDLGRFRLDPGARRLETLDGEPVVTTAKAFDALVYFVEHPGVPIPRRKLIEVLWPDTVVEENGLSQAISALRRALGDGYIVTVPGRGYQFIAEVRTARPMEAPEDSAVAAVVRRKRLAWRNAAIFTGGIAAAAVLALVVWLTVGERGSKSPPAIAVMPFENLSSDTEQAYFSDGLAEELIEALKTAGLPVMARESSFALRGLAVEQIAATLGVAYVIGGSVARDANERRIWVRLSDASGMTVAARTFVVAHERILEVQQSVARTVVDELTLNLGVRPHASPGMPAGGGLEPDLRDGSPDVVGGTDNVRAFDHYLVAQYVRRQGFDPDTQRRAAAKFEQALALDQDFGLARVGLAQTFGTLADISIELDDIAEFTDKHARVVDRAIELAPELPAALGLLARRQARAGQWQNAEATLKAWVAKSGGNDYEAIHSYGSFLSDVGRAREALPYLEQARRMNPVLAEPYVSLSVTYDALGESERAVDLDRSARGLVGYGMLLSAAQFWRTLAVDDVDVDRVRRSLVDARVALEGDDPEEVEKYLGSEELPPDLNAFGRLVVGSVQRLDDRERGREYLRAALEDPGLQTAPGMFNLALFAAYFDDADLSIDALRRMPSSDLAAIPHALLWIPLMDTVRRDPEFAVLMRELGFSAYWRESGWPEHCRPLGDDDLECS